MRINKTSCMYIDGTRGILYILPQWKFPLCLLLPYINIHRTAIIVTVFQNENFIMYLMLYCMLEAHTLNLLFKYLNTRF